MLVDNLETMDEITGGEEFFGPNGVNFGGTHISWLTICVVLFIIILWYKRDAIKKWMKDRNFDICGCDDKAASS